MVIDELDYEFAAKVYPFAAPPKPEPPAPPPSGAPPALSIRVEPIGVEGWTYGMATLTPKRELNEPET